MSISPEDLESIRKIHWVTKEASKLPSTQLRLAVPKISGKIKGEPQAKNPYGANKLKVKETIPGVKPIKPLTNKLAALNRDPNSLERIDAMGVGARRGGILGGLGGLALGGLAFRNPVGAAIGGAGGLVLGNIGGAAYGAANPDISLGRRIAIRRQRAKALADQLATKEASSDYYRRNRARILARNRAYRSQNKAMLSMKAKRYRMKVKSGAIRKRKRVHSGMGYIYAGY